jgi:tellurite resistance protein TerC
MAVESIGNPALWIGFIVFVLAMLALDLGVFHRKAHAVSLREAAVWSAVWVALAATFNVGVYYWFGPTRALEFTAGYLVEKALSVDNVFVFAVIFAYFRVPAACQHRVLFWGILGALATRALFIVAGGAFLHRFHWAIYVFGALLAATGVKLLLHRGVQPHPERNPIVRLFTRLVPVVPRYSEGRFVVTENGRRYATPLLVALVTVEATDIVFAIDSVPAVFAVTSDPFVVFTSNVFAILGLRALYFLLAGVMDRFRYLDVGLATILLFVGAKMMLADVYEVPIGAALAAVAGILAASIVASMVASRRGATPRPAADRGSRSAA